MSKNTKKQFIDKLTIVQFKLKAPKNQYNSFGKYSYRNAEDILEAAKPLLQEYGLLMDISDEVRVIGDRYYVTSTVTIEDENGNKKTVTASAREEDTKKGMDGSQITGASSSYARKYALNGIFLIDDTKDSDSTNQGEEPKAKEQKKVPAKTQPAKTDEPKDSKEPSEKKQTSEKKKPVVEIGTAAFTGAVNWVAASSDTVQEAVKKLKTKYEISEEVEAEIEKAVVLKRIEEKTK